MKKILVFKFTRLVFKVFMVFLIFTKRKFVSDFQLGNANENPNAVATANISYDRGYEWNARYSCFKKMMQVGGRECSVQFLVEINVIFV